MFLVRPFFPDVYDKITVNHIDQYFWANITKNLMCVSRIVGYTDHTLQS